MTFPKHAGAIALVALMAGAAPVASVAQTQQALPSAEDVTDAELDAFVVAYRDMQTIDAEYSEQMAQVDGDAEVEALQEEARVKMTEAVQATSGIDIERFAEILALAQADPSVGEVIVEKLQQ